MSVLLQGNLTPAERSKRSILVGNIPGDATEEQLKNLLLQFGLIINFRFFNDSAGNQIGYAFCEYEKQDMAVRAIQQLNNFQFRGQILKVDTAASDKTKEELESFLQGGGNFESKGNDNADMDTSSEKAPEEITKAVASLPPEQMFELMKQMKMCIENNPHEARNLLLQNPQLAYALLQAQVIMRIVDPEVALTILNRPITAPTTLNNSASSEQKLVKESEPSVSGRINNPLFPSGIPIGPNFPTLTIPQAGNLLGNRSDIGASLMGIMPNVMIDKGFPVTNDQDMRQLFRMPDMRNLNSSDINKNIFNQSFPAGFDPRVLQGQNIRMQDPRIIPGSDPRAMPGPNPRTMPGPDPRAMPGPDPRAMPGPDPRAMPGSDPRQLSGSDPRGMPIPDPRATQILDPRMGQVDPRNTRAQDPRMMQVPGSDPRMTSGVDPRMMSGPNSKTNPMDGKIGSNLDPRANLGADPRLLSGDPRIVSGTDPRIGSVVDPRSRQSSDPRIKQSQGEDLRKPLSDGASTSASRLLSGARVPTITSAAPGNTTLPASRSSDILPNMASMPQDQEKAALIMQVLQLSDEQIAMLPPAQRQSILILKEQITRNHLV